MLSRLARLAGAELRVGALDALLRSPPPDAVAALEALLAAADGGDADARLVAVALAVWRARTDDAALLGALREAAHGSPRSAPVLDDGPGRRSRSPHARVEPAAPARALLPHFRTRDAYVQGSADDGGDGEGVVRLERLSWFRHGLDVARAVRPVLLRGVEPWAVARLLREPLLDLRTVLALVHAPASPVSLLRDVASSPRWMRSPAVRTALASNPRTPAPLVCAILASLPRARWSASLRREVGA